LFDRSSRPHHSPATTAAPIQLATKVLRWQQWTCAQIGRALGISGTTAARIVRRAGLKRRGRLQAPRVVERYEHAAVGDMVHIDTKKLGRIAALGHRVTGTHRGQLHHGIGWEFVHVAVDDHSRVAYVEVLADERTDTVRGFVRRALAWFRPHGVRVRRILTDNGSCYRSTSFRATCRGLRVVHQRTRPYTPRTNGKAERFIQTLLREWAYARPYYTSTDRARARDQEDVRAPALIRGRLPDLAQLRAPVTAVDPGRQHQAVQLHDAPNPLPVVPGPKVRFTIAQTRR